MNLMKTPKANFDARNVVSAELRRNTMVIDEFRRRLRR